MKVKLMQDTDPPADRSGLMESETAPGATDDPAPGQTLAPQNMLLEQLLIYARELNNLHQQGRRQLQVLRQLHTQLQLKEAQRSRLMSHLMTAQAAERNRIARGIHEGSLQHMNRLLLTLDRCSRRLADDAVDASREDLHRLRLDIQQIVTSLRSLINDLRPAVLDTVGLLGALDFLADRVSRETGITVTVSSRMGSRLDPTLETVVFRMVQEALTNIREHAAAQNAWIQLTRRGDELHLEVRDDGKGFSTENWRGRALAVGHVGLAGLYERAELAGGEMIITSSADEGTVIRCILPFVPAAADTEGGYFPEK
jgi:two-component system sensor histidine kinase DegS